VPSRTPLPLAASERATCPYLGLPDDPSTRFSFAAPAHRCFARSKPSSISLGHQGAYCLSSDFPMCDRYPAAAMTARAAASPAAPAPAPRLAPIPSRPVAGPETPARSRRIVSPATIASIVAVVAVFGASVLFGLANSGFLTSSGDGSSAQPSSGLGAVHSPAAGSSATATIDDPTPSALPSDGPTLTPTDTPTPGNTPKPTATPKPASSRFALLTKCPGASNCWIYRIRSGDNLYSIANYFGVSLEAVKSRNPWTQTEGLKVGRELRIPTPTR
jgi:LysM domain